MKVHPSYLFQALQWLVIALSICAFEEQRAQSQTQDDELRIMVSEWPSLDNSNLQFPDEIGIFEDLFHCRLFNYDEKRQILPEIAVTLPLLASAIKVRVEISNKIQFQDGSPLKPEDITASYEVFSRTQKDPARDPFNNIEKVESEKDAVIFYLKNPDPHLIRSLTFPILQKNSSFKPNSFSTGGCGPFILQKYSSNEIILIKNKFYFRENRPRISQIKFIRSGSEHDALTQINRGDIDILLDKNQSKIRYLERNNPAFKLEKSASSKLVYIGFNLEDKLTGNPILRDAISMGINRKELFNYTTNGFAITHSILSNPDKKTPSNRLYGSDYNPVSANEKIKKIGLNIPKNQKVHLSLKIKNDAPAINLAKAVARQLDKIGIQIQVETLNSKSFNNDIRLGKSQLWIDTLQDLNSVQSFEENFASWNKRPIGRNFSNYYSTLIDKIFIQNRSNMTLDSEEKALLEINHRISEEKPIIVLWKEENSILVRKNVRDFHLYEDGRYNSLIETHTIQ